MIGHLFKLVWNRKRANTLILVEILVSFLVLCALFTVALHGARGYSAPLGFEYRDRWLVSISGHPEHSAPEAERMAGRASLRQMVGMVRTLPEVKSAAVSFNCPYSGLRVTSVVFPAPGVVEEVLWDASSPEAMEVLDQRLLEGRWFETGDEEREEVPVVITKNLAELFFGAESAVGKLVPDYSEDDSDGASEDEEETVRRIVGVIGDYRTDGELARAPYMLINPMNIEDANEIFPKNLLLHIQPDTETAFEERLVDRLQEIEPGWSFSVTPLEKMRGERLRSVVMPFVVASVVAAFLVMMVGLGLVGVLWQNLLRRTGELGLRRAMGASAGAVQRQILGELLVLSVLAMVVGVAIFLQFPLLGIIGFVPWSTYLAGLALAMIAIVTIVTLCGVVPSWLATRVSPARALSYE